jgi:hypothetical protein
MSWLVVPDHPYVVSTVPLPAEAMEGVDGWRHAVVTGQPITIVPHDYKSWRTLRNRGLLAPSPIRRYHWPGPFDAPMQHQIATAEHFITHEKAFCLNGLRTGKTQSAIWAADYMMQERAVRRVLVVAPKFICDIVWERALFQTLKGRTAVVLKGDRKQKQMMARDLRFDWIITNPESLHLVTDCLPDVDLVVVDEFTKFKSMRVGGKKSRRYAALEAIAERRRLWLLSGTPAPQAPTDAYGPIRLVNPRPIRFGQFRDMTMMRISDYKWVPRVDAHETISKWMQPAIRFKREDCIEIPDVETAELDVPLTSQQRKIIQQFVDEAAATVAAGVRIEAVNAAATLIKILQVMCGGVYGTDEEGDRKTYHVNADPYLSAVETVVREAASPVLVFCNFQSSTDVTAEHLAKAGFRVGKLTRGVATISKEKVRSMDLFDAFQRGELDALVAVPQTMRYGLELTASHVVLWASPPFSYETYDQANGRVTGSSQKSKVMILHLVQSPVARELFARLRSKEALQNAVLDLIEGRLTI